jgi:hypothetical protein
MDLDLAKQSYNISCHHITKLNDKYKSENDLLVNKQFNCTDIMNIDDHDINNENNKKYIKYIDNIYITKKSCIYKSTEPDEFKWTSVFNDDLIKNDNARALFNENTRQKILTRY